MFHFKRSPRSWGLWITSSTSHFASLSRGLIYLFSYHTGWPDDLTPISQKLLIHVLWCYLCWLPSSFFFLNLPLPFPSCLPSLRKSTLIGAPDVSYPLLLCLSLFLAHVSLLHDVLLLLMYSMPGPTLLESLCEENIKWHNSKLNSVQDSMKTGHLL